MIAIRRGARLALAICMVLAERVALADWPVTAEVSAMPIRPASGTVVQQSNPAFSWPQKSGATGYELEIFDGRGRKVAWALTGANWYNIADALAPGDYRWRVAAKAGEVRIGVSPSYNFNVPTDARPFVPPNWSIAYEHARHRSRPRATPRGQRLVDLRIALHGERRDGWRGLVARVAARSKMPLVSEPSRFAGGDQRQYHQWMFDLPKQLHNDFQQIEEASLVWLIEGDQQALTDAKRRVIALAALDPMGATAYEPTHHPARRLLWALTIGYDRMYWQFNQEERRHLAEVINRRFEQIERSIAGPRQALARLPFDSHGSIALHTLAAVASVMAGEISESETRFRKFLDWLINWPSPWGDEDGGFSNGSAYASWNLEGLLTYWDAIGQSAGIDIYEKPWVRNLGRFLLYFTPPGTPSHLFGDGAEKRVAQYVTLALAARLEGDDVAWLRATLKAEDISNVIVLSAPPTRRRDSLPSPPRNASLHLPSIGWVAMHSRLEPSDRTSVYFKSSPYGSISHSHADQNSFVVDIDGTRALIDGGYYDWYGSPHRKGWYETTRAHNAITYDGGRGQTPSNKASRGQITAFSDDGAIAYATGDAVEAYDGELKQARRTILFSRPDTILVIDQLHSEKPRSFEWNLHSSNPFAALSDRKVASGNGKAKWCVESLYGPASVIREASSWSAEPEGIAGVRKQHHVSFVTQHETGPLTWVFWIAVDCRPNRPSVSVESGKVSIRLKSGDLVIDASGFVKRPNGSRNR